MKGADRISSNAFLLPSHGPLLDIGGALAREPPLTSRRASAASPTVVKNLSPSFAANTAPILISATSSGTRKPGRARREVVVMPAGEAAPGAASRRSAGDSPWDAGSCRPLERPRGEVQ